jgi:hypothetical protein
VSLEETLRVLTDPRDFIRIQLSRRVTIAASSLTMASGQNDWIIQDSEEEDQCSPQLDARRPVRPVSPILPGTHPSSYW